MTTALADPELLRRVADTLGPLPYEAWHFGDSIAFEAMVAASDALSDPGYLRFAQGFARGWAASARIGFRPLDCTAPGAALCMVAERTGDRVLVDTLVRLADYLIARPMIGGVFQTWARSPLRESYGEPALTPAERDLMADPGPGVFVDCLHFDPPFLTALSRLTGNPRWIDEAVQQALGYVDLLQHPDTGLFSHFFLQRTGRSHIPGWGRGQGWALLGLMSVIAAVPASHQRDRLVASAQALLSAMAATQRPDGHWNAVVDRPQGGVETSTAAFMVSGFRAAEQLELVDAADVSGLVERATRATRDSLAPDGVLQGVSAAVWACTSIAHYDQVPRGFVVPWGQGAATLAIVAELERGVRKPGTVLT